MDNWDVYVDLGYGIPRYAVMEILWAMRDEAKPAGEKGYDWFVKVKDGFGVAKNQGLGMSLLANCRCVGLEIGCLEVVVGEAGELGVFFNRILIESEGVYIARECACADF